MIEVEKKFVLKIDDLINLTAGAKLVSEKIFTDVYYDSSDYYLTKNNIWLRSRAGNFELKFPVFSLTKNKSVDYYEEIINEKDISQKLNIKFKDNLKISLELVGYQPFAIITSKRKKYQKEEFTIDIDKMDFGYNLAEIELIVENQEKTKVASQKIINFAKSHGLETTSVRGKVIEYIKRNSPEHFKILESSYGFSL